MWDLLFCLCLEISPQHFSMYISFSSVCLALQELLFSMRSWSFNSKFSWIVALILSFLNSFLFLFPGNFCTGTWDHTSPLHTISFLYYSLFVPVSRKSFQLHILTFCCFSFLLFISLNILFPFRLFKNSFIILFLCFLCCFPIILLRLLILAFVCFLLIFLLPSKSYFFAFSLCNPVSGFCISYFLHIRYLMFLFDYSYLIR